MECMEGQLDLKDLKESQVSTYIRIKLFIVILIKVLRCMVRLP